MIERKAIRHLFCGPRTDLSITAAATLLGWSPEALAIELSAAYLIPVDDWPSRSVPWHAIATLAFQQTSYETIERELCKQVATLPSLIRLTPVTIRLPRYQVVAIRSAAERDCVTVDAFLGRHFIELACLEATDLKASIPGYAEALHWPNQPSRLAVSQCPNQ